MNSKWLPSFQRSLKLRTVLSKILMSSKYYRKKRAQEGFRSGSDVLYKTVTPMKRTGFVLYPFHAVLLRFTAYLRRHMIDIGEHCLDFFQSAMNTLWVIFELLKSLEVVTVGLWGQHPRWYNWMMLFLRRPTSEVCEENLCVLYEAIKSMTSSSAFMMDSLAVRQRVESENVHSCSILLLWYSKE